MSVKAVNWALYDTPKSLDPANFRILLIIADNCDNDGHGFYFSTQHLAELTGLSKRSIQYHLRSLEQQGLIRPGNQALVAQFPANKRPRVYDVVLTSRQPQTAVWDTPDASMLNVEPEPTETSWDSSEDMNPEFENESVYTTAAEEPAPVSSHDEVRGADFAPQNVDNSPNNEVRGATGVQQGCNRGANMFAPKPIKPIKPIKRESTRARKNENQKSSSPAPAPKASTNRTDVRTSVLSSTYDPTSDEQARMLAYSAGVDLLQAFDAFKDYYAATGKHLTDWGAKFRLWLRREKHFAQPAATPAVQTRSVSPTPVPSKALGFASATGRFADDTRRILNDPELSLTLKQKQELFTEALNILLETHSADSVRSFILARTTAPVNRIAA